MSRYSKHKDGNATMPLALLVVFLLAGVFLLWRMPRPKAGSDATADRRSVSVIIPARDEAHRITPLLASLQSQTLVPDEILVVDDGSSDDTALIAQQHGVAVMPAGEHPEDWHGKTWACWQGALASAGDILVFLDADTFLAPHGLQALVNTYLTRGGLVSVQPYHVTDKLYEQLSAFFNLVVMAGLNTFTPLRDRLTPGGAFGPCMVCQRDAYMRLDGHASVRTETIEDIPLGKRFADAGLPVSALAGRGTISFRMYPGGLGELIEGHSKGFGYGALSICPWVALLVSAWITGCFSTGISLPRALLFEPWGYQTMLRGSLYLAYAVHIGWVLRRIGRFQAWVAPLFPIPLVFFGLVMLRSLILSRILGRVRWKGRTITTGRGRGAA